MTRVILIHANCRNRTALGDFVFAGNIARDLKKALMEQKKDVDVVLVSTAEGMPRYEKLYGKPVRGRMSVDAVSVGVSSLEAFDAVRHTVIAFIDANRCKHAPAEIVKRVIAPETRFLFIGNMNQTISLEPFDQIRYAMERDRQQPGLYDCFERKLFLTAAAGIGSPCVGLPTIHRAVDLPALSPRLRFQLSAAPYGFIYAARVAPTQAHAFIGQYMQLADLRYYVLVGNFFGATEDILTAYRAEGADATTRRAPLLVQHDALPYPLMRRMVADASGSLVATSGVSSTLEAMRDGKLTFNQYLSVNEPFIAAYLAAVKSVVLMEDTLKDGMSALIIRLSEQLFAEKPLSREGLEETRGLLKQEAVSTQLMAMNKKILDTASGKIAPGLLNFIFAPAPGAATDAWQRARVLHTLRKPDETKRPDFDEALRRAASLGALFEMKVLMKVMSPEMLNRAEPTAGMTALHFAVRFGHVDCARALIEAGAAVESVDNSGKTPEAYASGETMALFDRPHRESTQDVSATSERPLRGDAAIDTQAYRQSVDNTISSRMFFSHCRRTDDGHHFSGNTYQRGSS